MRYPKLSSIDGFLPFEADKVEAANKRLVEAWQETEAMKASERREAKAERAGQAAVKRVEKAAAKAEAKLEALRVEAEAKAAERAKFRAWADTYCKSPVERVETEAAA